MSKSIRILFVEDSEDDTVLLVREIRSGGYGPVYERVDTPDAMKDALKNKEWDAIICDYAMPEFSMSEALKILQKSEHDLPFILVSGTIGEEVAVEAMKAGAHDYIMKDRLKRLVPAIEREIREAGKRQQARQAENAIQALVKSTVGTTGKDFFNKVVSSICEWLGTDYAFIWQITDGENVKALSMQHDGKINFENYYKLRGTPCGNIAENGYCFYPEGVCKLYPDATVLAEIGAEGYVGTPLRNKNGKTIGILCVVSRHKLNLPHRTAEVMDIIAAKASAEIERKEIMEDLQRAKEYSESLINNSMDMIISVDKDRNIVTFNQAAEKVFGYSREEVLGKHVGILYDDSSQSMLIHNTTRDSGVYEGEILNRKKNGDTFISQLSSTALCDKNGNVIGIMGMSRDVTERKQAEREQVRLASFPQENPNPILECDEQGSVLYINPALRCIMEGLKCSAEQLLPEGHTELMRKCLQEGKSIKEVEVEVYDHVYVWTYHPAIKLNLVHIHGIDITERKKASEQIKASLNEKEVLLKEIHHRVKNNLQVISSLLNLQSKYIGDEEVLSIFRESQNRVKSMSLVHEELYRSKDLARIDFAEYVRSLVNNLFRSYGTNSCDIIPKIDVVNVFLDVNTAIPCGLIINELVSNSLKYAFPSIPVQDRYESKKGEIKISLRRIDDLKPKPQDMESNTTSKSANGGNSCNRNSRDIDSKIELIVNDNGMGIPEDIDFRDTKSLGLQLVNTLTSQIDGTIELNRENGTEFRIRFEK